MAPKIKEEPLSPSPKKEPISSPSIATGIKQEPHISTFDLSSASTFESYDDFVIISDDEDDELDDTDVASAHNFDTHHFVKQEFSDSLPTSLPLIDEFHQDLVNSFSRAIGSQINIAMPEVCCSIRHGQIRFVVYDLPPGIEWLDMQTQAREAVMISTCMIGCWVSPNGDININMAKDALIASTRDGSSAGYMVADDSTIQTCLLSMTVHNCDAFLRIVPAAQKEYQTIAYILSADLRLNPHDVTKTLRFFSDNHTRMRDMSCKSLIISQL